MFGFGKKKDEEEKAEKEAQERMAESMRSMSGQIESQAKEIKALEDELTQAQKDAKSGDAAEQALLKAKARMRSMEAEMEKLKDQLAKGAADAVDTAKSTIGGIGSSIAGAAAGVTRVGSGAPLGGAAPEGGLQVNGTAYVRKVGGRNLNLRNAPGLNSNVLVSLPPGTQMTLLAGPQAQDNYTWWNIRTSDGREGWVAGEELVTQPE
jgi:hypothetical protein